MDGWDNWFACLICGMDIEIKCNVIMMSLPCLNWEIWYVLIKCDTWFFMNFEHKAD